MPLTIHGEYGSFMFSIFSAAKLLISSTKVGIAETLLKLLQQRT